LPVFAHVSRGAAEAGGAGCGQAGHPDEDALAAAAAAWLWLGSLAERPGRRTENQVHHPGPATDHGTWPGR